MGALTRLLASLFDGEELLRFLQFRPGGQWLIAQTNPSWGLQALCEKVVLLLERRGEIDGPLVDALVDAFPRRHGDIHVVAQELGVDSGHGRWPMTAAQRGSIRGVVELELAIERSSRSGPHTSDLFSIHLSVREPNGVAERRSFHQCFLDRAALYDRGGDPTGVGGVLGRFLFGAPEVGESLERVRGLAEDVRVRLVLDPSAYDLQALRWETLCDPRDVEAPLLSDARVHFSRYVGRSDWRPVKLRPRAPLTALVVVASRGPSSLMAGHLRTLLGDGRVAALSLGEKSALPPSRVNIIAGLRASPDLLYLSCGGRRDTQAQPILLLTGDDDAPDMILGVELLKALQELEQLPRVVILVDDEARDGAALADDSVLFGLAPQLIEIGVAAVLVVHGGLARAALEAVMTEFLRELMRNGIVDHAVAAGRIAGGSSIEAWQMVLFTGLRRGRIWYEAGFGVGGLGSWDAIRVKIEDGECTPIIGPGLFETMLELRPWLARRWSREYLFPLATAQQEELTSVAQYLASQQGADFPHRRLIRDLPVALRERLALPADAPPRPLAALLTALREQRFAGRSDPYRILADLPLRVFILGCHDPLFVQALRERGKRPQVGVMPWWRGPRDVLPRSYQPSVEEPLVYYLFGALDAPRSLVLTQDDYVDFLLSLQRPEVREAIPKVVLARLVDTSLLFLGFQIDSWEFRAVFRTIMQQEGMESALRSRGPHIAAQIEPEDGRVIDPVCFRIVAARLFRRAWPWNRRGAQG